VKIAITGASGFVGQYVLRRLIQVSAEIVALTRDETRLAEWRNQIRVVKIDLSHSQPNCYTRLGNPDVLIHLAWDGLPNYKSLHHFETELPRQYLFLQAIIEGGLPSLVVTGTCFEYGMQSGELSEQLLAQPRNPYGYAKDALRRQLEFLQTVRPFDFTWARLFYMFGEGQPKSSLYPQLKEAVSRGDRIFNMSAGEQLRDYLHVEEIARLIVELATHRCNCGIVNVCSGKPISIRNLVEGWLREYGWEIQLNLGHYSYVDYEPLAFWGARQKLQRILEVPGITPEIRM
jgi:nucleoside-diphosphate-sugar epimerase